MWRCTLQEIYARRPARDKVTWTDKACLLYDVTAGAHHRAVSSTSATLMLKRNFFKCLGQVQRQSITNQFTDIHFSLSFYSNLEPNLFRNHSWLLARLHLSLKTLFGTCTFSVSFTLMICFLSHPQYTIMLVWKIYMLGCTSLFRNFSDPSDQRPYFITVPVNQIVF